LGESQVVALVDVHGKHNGQILDVAGVCVNRIGTKRMLGIYPVEVTVEAVVEGDPVKVTRVIECYREIVLNYSAFGNVRWTQGPRAFFHQLTSGNWFFSNLPLVCFNRDTTLSDRESVGRMTPGWTNSIQEPDILEVFHHYFGALSDYRAKSPKILLETLMVRVKKLDHPLDNSRFVQDKIPGWYPINKSYVLNPGKGPAEDVFQTAGAKIIPFSEAVRLPWLKTKLQNISQSDYLVFTKQESRQFATFFSDNKPTGVPVGFEKMPTDEKLRYRQLKMPFRYLGSNIWEPDQERAGISVYYRTGLKEGEAIYVDGDREQIQKYKSWRTGEKLLISGKLFDLNSKKLIYDFDNKRIIKTNNPVEKLRHIQQK